MADGERLIYAWGSHKLLRSAPPGWQLFNGGLGWRLEGAGQRLRLIPGSEREGASGRSTGRAQE